jgi:hypothetical protein
MRFRNMISALAVIAVLGASGAAVAGERKTPEQRLAKLLEGRVAGEPVDCIYMPMINDTTVYDKTAIVYRSGDTLYVNRPQSGVESLDSDDVMVLDTRSSQLCDVDVVRMHDQASRSYSGTVFLGKFVPYRKAGKDGN